MYNRKSCAMNKRPMYSSLLPMFILCVVHILRFIVVISVVVNGRHGKYANHHRKKAEVGESGVQWTVWHGG